jgi:MFS family permease
MACDLSDVDSVEMATSSWIVFSCGRVFQYLCIGIIENAGPTYASETSPAALRAACVSFLFIVQGLGGVITSGIFQGISTSTNPNIWLVPAGIQLIPGVIVLLSTPFIVGESDPRQTNFLSSC